MKTAVIDVGGGLRGIYAAGAFDCMLDEGVRFDVGIGISAGSANIASFFAGQRGRNLLFFSEYPFRREYMSGRNIIKKHAYLDLDYIYGTLSNEGGENPLDYRALMENPAQFYVVACDADTGETRYFDKHDIRRDDYAVFKASSAIPLICTPCQIGGARYFDGALGDTVPLDKALSLGCERIVLLLTKPRGLRRSSRKDLVLARGIARRYPAAAERLRGRAARYNEGVARAEELEREGRLLIVAPESTFGVDTLTRDRGALLELYGLGYSDAHRIRDFLTA